MYGSISRAVKFPCCRCTNVVIRASGARLARICRSTPIILARVVGRDASWSAAFTLPPAPQLLPEPPTPWFNCRRKPGAKHRRYSKRHRIARFRAILHRALIGHRIVAGKIMAKHALTVVTALTAVLMLTSCTETPKETETKKADATPAAPPEPVAGQTAFYQMYKPAREWSKDIMPLTLAGSDLEGVKSEGGKFPMWTAVFVSPSLRQARTFFYSVV